MTSSLRSYPEMKDSGVGALGRVPAHWRIRKLGQIGSFSKGNGGSKMDELRTGIPCIRYGDLYTSHTYFIHQSRSCISRERVEDYTPISHGDVLFAASGETIEEIGKSAVNLIKDEAYCGGDIILFRPSIQAHPKFMGYATDFRPATNQKARMGRGFTIVHVYSDQLKRLAVPLPPLHEQTSIVRFLDEADRRIRRYIQAKEKLIALLEEQKQVVVHQAVTGRMDVRTGRPYPAYKPSGVEWLGDVPDHWEVQRLGHLASKFGSGVTPRGGATVYQESGIPFLRSQNVHFGGLRVEDVARIPESLHQELSGSQVKAGDVLLNITGASIGRSCSVPNNFGEGNVNQHVCIIRPNQSCILPDLLVSYLFIPHMQREIQFEQSGASREGLTLKSIRDFRVVVPPILEQAPIVKYIHEATTNIATILGHTRSEIDLVSEYRTRLIADVVTGKLDVRKAAAALPEEPDEPNAVNADCAGAEGKCAGPFDRDRRTAVPATQEETTP